MMDIYIFYFPNHKRMYLGTWHMYLFLYPNSLDKYKMYIFHFVRMDIKLDKHNFFCMDHIRMFQGICHSFELFSSRKLVIYRLCIRCWADGVFRRGICIFPSENYTRMRQDMKDICSNLNSSGMGNCMKYNGPQKCMVNVMGKHILIFSCCKQTYLGIFNMLCFYDSNILELCIVYKIHLISMGDLQDIRIYHSFFDKQMYLDTIGTV